MSVLKKAATGHLLKGPAAHLVNQCGLPESCPEGLADAYRIKDYADGVLEGSTHCTFGCVGDDWDGVFTRLVPESPCLWQVEGQETLCIDGRDMGLSFMELVAATYWQFQVGCVEDIADPGQWIIWRGRKLVGATPEGTYTRVLGWDETPTLIIESVP